MLELLCRTELVHVGRPQLIINLPLFAISASVVLLPNRLDLQVLNLNISKTHRSQECDERSWRPEHRTIPLLY